ncbi:MAG: Crp/Fnr family transcriptional regulator [Burkholderiales bacterium]|nr:Crp/Fnr family transcriptional regulator [Burkholderiales bacterium]
MPEADTQPSALGLRRVALLEGLPGAALEALARECAWRNFAAGQHIVSRDAKDRDVYLIIAGRVRVTIYSAAGRQVTFRDLSTGEFFGDIAAIDGAPRSADVVALESTLAASLAPAVFRLLLREHPDVAERILRGLATLVRRLSERVIDLSTLGVQNRIHADLLRRARAAGVAGNTARIEPAPKHADVASEVSTYREQVTRELSALAKAGIVVREGNALVVRDVTRLERLVVEVRAST